MPLRNGEFFKRKKDFVIEKFTTQEGLFNFGVGTAFFYSVVIRFIDDVHAFFLAVWAPFFNIPLLANYLTLLSVGIVFTIIGLGITFVLMTIFHWIKGLFK